METFYKLLADHAFSTRIDLFASDTFAYACSDGVMIDETGIPLLMKCYEKWGSDGVTAFVSAVRGQDVIKPWRTRKFKKAASWLATQKLPNEIESDNDE